MELVRLGEFSVESGKLVIVDPCYETDETSDGIVVPNGAYSCFIEICNNKESKGWGERCSKLIVINKQKEYLVEKYIKEDDFLERLKFLIHVDSGQVGLYDSKYVYLTNDEDYDQICTHTLGKNMGSIVSYGVTSMSGYGDGSYYGYYHKDDNDNVDCVIIDYFDTYYIDDNDNVEEEFEDVEYDELMEDNNV